MDTTEDGERTNITTSHPRRLINHLGAAGEEPLLETRTLVVPEAKGHRHRVTTMAMETEAIVDQTVGPEIVNNTTVAVEEMAVIQVQAPKDLGVVQERIGAVFILQGG